MKCEWYKSRGVTIRYNFTSSSYKERPNGICNGAKERDKCRCGGDRAKCDFYPEVRKKAKQLNQEYRDKKELEFYRWWITEHNLNVEVATSFEKWLNDIS